MGIVGNPFGVGMSGHDVVDLKATCVCCEMEFGFRGPRTAPVMPKRCQACAGHNLDGVSAERMQALEDHAAQALSRARWAVAKAGEMAEEKKDALEDQKASQRASYRSHKRREWTEQKLEAILAVHLDSATDSTCGCGLPAPCPTVQAADDFEREKPHPDYSGYVYRLPPSRPSGPLGPRTRLGHEA